MKFYYFLFIVFLISCSKSADPLDRFENNSIVFKVFKSNGDSVSYSYYGSNAPMFISTLFQKFTAEGKRNSNERVISFGVDPYDPTNSIIACTYSPDNSGVNIFSTDNTSNPRSIIFNNFSNGYASGSFAAKCKNLTDSILIIGQFSGAYNY